MDVPRYGKDIARRLRKSETDAERVLWAQLRNRGLNGAKFRRQHPIGRYIADFYCKQAYLVIELEGSSHEPADQREYDAVRIDTLEQSGIRLITFKNDQVMQDIPAVLDMIVAVLNSPHPVQPGT